MILSQSVRYLNGGISPSYQWWLNGAAIPGATGSTYTTNTLADGDNVYVTMNSSVPCAINPATSNTISISLLPLPTIINPAYRSNILPGCSYSADTFGRWTVRCCL